MNIVIFSINHVTISIPCSLNEINIKTMFYEADLILVFDKYVLFDQSSLLLLKDNKRIFVINSLQFIINEMKWFKPNQLS